MKIIFASDHAGYELKQKLISFVHDLGYETIEVGDRVPNPEDDYTDFIPKAAEMVSTDPENTRAIILGGSGEGEAMAANRYKGVRAAEYYGGSEDIVRLSREHNDSNILSLGARFLNEEEAKHALKLWLNTGFSGEERHIRRNQKLDQLG